MMFDATINWYNVSFLPFVQTNFVAILLVVVILFFLLKNPVTNMIANYKYKHSKEYMEQSKGWDQSTDIFLNADKQLNQALSNVSEFENPKKRISVIERDVYAVSMQIKKIDENLNHWYNVRQGLINKYNTLQGKIENLKKVSEGNGERYIPPERPLFEEKKNEEVRRPIVNFGEF